MKTKKFRFAMSPKELAVLDTALGIKVPERHAYVLTDLSIKRKLDDYVVNLMKRYPDYSEMMQRYQRMKDDPTQFYFTSKGNKSFPRYGSLSLEYTNGSPYRLVLRLLQDANSVRAYRVYMRKEERQEAKDWNLYPKDLFEDLRIKELESAFRQDMRSNKITDEILEALLKKLKWENLSNSSKEFYGTENEHSKLEVMDFLCIFFSLDIKKEFLEKWNKEELRSSLTNNLTNRFYSDPRVNPHLIEMKPKDIGTRKFEEKYQAFLSAPIFDKNGRQLNREEIDPRSIA